MKSSTIDKTLTLYWNYLSHFTRIMHRNRNVTSSTDATL